MSTFSYNTNIPAANNDPADDQTLMQTNYSSISQLIDVDHVGFNTAGGGRHDQVTFAANNVPGAQTDPVSVLYTNNNAAGAHPMLLHKNSQGIFPIGAIRAFAAFDGTGGNPITTTQSYNVSTIGHSGTGHYEITLTANAVNSALFGVVALASQSSGGVVLLANYNITGTGTFTISTFQFQTFALRDSQNVTFVVYQV